MDEGRCILNDPQGRRFGNLGISPATRITGRVIFGLVLVVLGFLWTLDSLDLIDSDQILRWWPIVLVLFGLARLTGIGSRRHTVMGAVFTVVGGWMLRNRLDLIDLRLSELWPVVLVAIGAFMVLNSLRRTAPAESGGLLGTGAGAAAADDRVGHPEHAGVLERQHAQDRVAGVPRRRGDRGDGRRRSRPASGAPAGRTRGARVEPATRVDGLSLAPLLRGVPTPWRTDFLYEHWRRPWEELLHYLASRPAAGRGGRH